MIPARRELDQVRRCRPLYCMGEIEAGSVGDADEAHRRFIVGLKIYHDAVDVVTGGNEIPFVVTAIPCTRM
jgi:hypothetical protein